MHNYLTTPQLPPIAPFSAHQIVINGQMISRFLDPAPSTVEYLKTSRAAIPFLRDWTLPETNYKPAFAAALLAPRYFIADIIKRTQLSTDAKATALLDEHFSDLFPLAVELSNFVDDDGVGKQTFTAVGIEGLKKFLHLLVANVSPERYASAMHRARVFKSYVSHVSVERENEIAVAQLVAEIDSIALDGIASGRLALKAAPRNTKRHDHE